MSPSDLLPFGPGRSRFTGVSPQTILIRGFAGLILLGTAALSLDLATTAKGAMTMVDALFTATSAVCVTGLTVVDTGSELSAAGQVLVLFLIQCGGLGLMLFTALAYELLGRRLSLRAQSAFDDAYFSTDAGLGFRARARRIVLLVAGLEGAGALLLYVGFSARQGSAGAAWSALFHSVSAFCNAGFSLYSDSLVGWQSAPFVVIPISLLIVLGGLGHPVLLECGRLVRSRKRPGPRMRALSLHSRLVLFSSLVLVVGGAALLFVTGATGEGTGVAGNAGSALFQSITARTAGFNTTPIHALPVASLLVLVVLMFVGGSPGSCAGGVKTTTAVLWLAELSSRLRGRKRPAVLGRHVPGELARRAATLVGFALLWNALGTVLLAVSESGAHLEEILFEQVSAFGTVGLSTGLTTKLSGFGKVWLVLTMFVGRVGPLTLVVWAFKQRTPGVRLPEGKVMIG